MFSGREYFSSLGLYDMRNRVYDPVMGRFYQTDPIGFEGDPTNLYRFCGNNPLLGGDPTGLQNSDSGLYFEIGGGGISSDWSSGSADFFNDPIGYSSISWSFYADTSIYLMGVGGATFATPVSYTALVGAPRSASEVTVSSTLTFWQIAADHMVRQIIDAVSSAGEKLGVNQSDLDALMAMPMTGPVIKTGLVIEDAVAGLRLFSAGRVATAKSATQLEFAFTKNLQNPYFVLYKTGQFNPTMLRQGEYILNLPKIEGAGMTAAQIEALNWEQNVLQLSKAMSIGNPIREANPMALGGWLQRERDFSSLRGWRRVPQGNDAFWVKPNGK